ncbi:MAG: GDSL-type esterase/lipase family protein [Gordonia sp. (in: high G+C Gram-positive bacteria)]|jgi:O-antigen/teichoic acid export membrane protein/lysophospholipase L1-like esterase|nr:GDSL-type esterase/lipase family protein [Gordonia sp. (in: high G+C Gram-positive bacteria)]
MADTARGKRILRDATLRIGARAAGSVILGVTLLLLATTMSVDDFGRFILAYTVGMALGLVAGLGAPLRVLRVNALDDPNGAASWQFTVHTAATAVVFGIAFVGLTTAGAAAVLVAGAVFAYSDTVQNYAQSHLAGLGRHSSASALGVAQRAVPLVAIVAAQQIGTTSTSVVLIAAFAATAVLGLVAPVRSVLAGRARRRTAAEVGGGYWTLSMSGVLAQLQVPAFALFASATTVGWFALATRVTGPLTLVAAAMSTVLIPELSRRVGEARDFDRVFRRYLAVTVGYLVIVVLGALPGAWLVVRVVGDKYSPAQSMLAGLIVAAGVSSVSQSVSASYIARGRPGRVTAAIVIGGSVTIVLLAVCGRAGATGLVWVAPVAGQAVVLAVLVDGLRYRPMAARVTANVERAALVGAAVVAALIAVAVPMADRPAFTGGITPAAHLITTPADRPAVRILLVGDSLVEGTAFGGRGDNNWTRIAQARLARRSPADCPVVLRVSGRGGAGYVTSGLRHTTFLDQVRAQMTDDVSVLILAGSNNDSSPAYRNSANYRIHVKQVIAAARAVNPRVQIVITSALRVPGARRPPGAAAVRASLQKVAIAERATFVDPNPLRWFARGTVATVLGGDGRHPTDLGHQMIADGMAPILASAARSGRCTT